MVVDGRYATQLLARHWWETVFFNYRDSGFVQLQLGVPMKFPTPAIPSRAMPLKPQDQYARLFAEVKTFRDLP